MSEINVDDLYTIRSKAFASSHVLNKNFQSISVAHNELESRMRNIETGEPVSDAEIQIARGTYETLNERLNNIGKEKRENILIEGMQVTDLTYSSDGMVSFTIEKGEVLIEGNIVKINQNTAFSQLALDQNYRVVVCDASAEISVIASDSPGFDFPTIGQNKRPLYIFKKEADNQAIFYDCRHWGVSSLMGWHFTLQEAFDDFIVNYLEALHPLGHRHLTLEYTGIANRLETREASFPTLKSESSTTKEKLASQLKQWTFHLKGKGGGAVFLVEGIRVSLLEEQEEEFGGYQGFEERIEAEKEKKRQIEKPPSLATYINGSGFKEMTIENISFQLPPWYFPLLDHVAIDASPKFIVKDCLLDYDTNNKGGNEVHLLSVRSVYRHTNIKMSFASRTNSALMLKLSKKISTGLSVNDIPIYDEGILINSSDSISPIAVSKTYIFFQYTLGNINLNTSSAISLFPSTYQGPRLPRSSDFVLVSAFAKGVDDQITQSFANRIFNNDISSLGYFYLTLNYDYQFRSTTTLIRNRLYNNVTLTLIFKIYDWKDFFFE